MARAQRLLMVEHSTWHRWPPWWRWMAHFLAMLAEGGDYLLDAAGLDAACAGNILHLRQHEHPLRLLLVGTW